MIWEEIINISKKNGWKTHQTFQEMMQKAILTSLSREGVFNYIVFQGGTSLKLFYENPRFSEDLDFVLKKSNNNFDLTKKISKIKSFVDNSFPFIDKTDINVQKNNQYMQRFILKTISNVPEQRLRIHIELANVPSYSNEPKILNYPPLNPAVRVEAPSEILADKITALGNRDYLKGRDIWDVHFLIFEKQISIPWSLVIQKAKDYGATPKMLKDELIVASKRLRDNGVLILSNEMKRFLPKSFLDQYSNEFNEIVNKVATKVENVKNVDFNKDIAIEGEQ